MAIAVVWIALASSSDAGSPEGSATTLQFDAFTALPVGQTLTITDPSFDAAYVQLFAELANFDADAGPDGWIASVIIRARDGSPLMSPVRANFAITYDAPRYRPHGIDYGTIRDPSTRSVPRMRWTRPLQFDGQGVATVTLPARNSFQRMLDWDSIDGLGSIDRSSVGYRRFDGRRIDRLRGSRYHRHFVTQDLYDRIDYPIASWMRISVAIPGQRTLEAVTPIDLRPQVLVDTPYRYR